MTTALQLRSLISDQAKLEISVVEVEVPEPGAGEVIVNVEAAPINPSDLFLLTGPMVPGSVHYEGTAQRPIVRADIIPEAMPGLSLRINQSMPVGNEGAGVVIAVGEGAEHLLGKTVTMVSAGTYATHLKAKAAMCHVLPDGVTPAQGASGYVNPMTALCFLETMRRDGFSALINTAAASSLGQMLNRLCAKDGVPLVNIVRKPEQVHLLKGLGAEFVCDSSSPDFKDELTAAIDKTGAMLAFDAIGGGSLADTILTCMEAVAAPKAAEYSRYGSAAPKKLYTYGALDTGPLVISRRFGFSWSISGWLLTFVLPSFGADVAQRLRQRAIDEITTTFATSYTAKLSLAEMLTEGAFTSYLARSTGEKYLVCPNGL